MRDVILREGTTLRLRAPNRADADAVLAFVNRLSPESRYFRFHGLPPVGPRLVEPFLDPDWDERGALIGTLVATEEERVVALGTWSRLRDRTAAEAAFAVDDEHQGRGIGTRLVEQLAGLAADAGIERFVAEVLASNLAMLQVFERVGFEVARELEGGVVEVVFPIAATDSYRTTVDTRDHFGVVASLQPFFAPESVAVLGASPRAGTIGGLVFRNIVSGGFEGRAYPVNRDGVDVAGVKGYGSLAELPERVDLAVFCLPAALVLETAEDALERGVRALCVITAGFAEVGVEGAAREARLLELVRSRGARLIGPNCLGIAVTSPRLNATFAPRAFPPGRIAFSSQSGALGLALLERSDARGLGFSAFVSVGNKADISSNDLLEYWEDDPETDVVLLYLESFGNPRKFGRLARRVSRRKPILAMKSGVSRAGARAARSHTAALAGSEAAVAALFRQAGVIRAATVEELVDVAAILSTQPLLAGNEWPSSRTPEDWGSSAPTPVTRPGSSSSLFRQKPASSLPLSYLLRPRSPTLSTCSGPRPRRPTPGPCQPSWPTRASTLSLFFSSRLQRWPPSMLRPPSRRHAPERRSLWYPWCWRPRPLGDPSLTPSRRRGPLVAPPSGPNGYAGRRGRLRKWSGSTAPRPKKWLLVRSPRTTICGSSRQRCAHCSGPTGFP